MVKANVGLVALVMIGMSASPASAKCVGVAEFSGTKLPMTCLTTAEAKTVRMRIFRAELAVAALSCKQQPQYNQLVTTHEDTFVKGGRALRSLFNRLHNAQATKKLNRFVTHLSNRASLRRLAAQGYCSKMADIFSDIASLQPQEFADYIQRRPIKMAFAEPADTGRTVASVRATE